MGDFLFACEQSRRLTRKQKKREKKRLFLSVKTLENSLFLFGQEEGRMETRKKAAFLVGNTSGKAANKKMEK